MSTLKQIIYVMELSSQLLRVYQELNEEAQFPLYKKKPYDEIWSEISRIAYKNAASPEIQGYSDH